MLKNTHTPIKWLFWGQSELWWIDWSSKPFRFSNVYLFDMMTYSDIRLHITKFMCRPQTDVQTRRRLTALLVSVTKRVVFFCRRLRWEGAASCLLPVVPRLHLAAQRGKCSFISVWYGVCQLWEKLCVSREGRNGLEFIWWCFFCYCLEEFKPGLPALLWPSGLFPRRRGLLRCIFRAFEVGGACCDAAGAASTLEMGHRDFSSLCVCVFGCEAQIIFNRVYIGCVYI